MPAGERRPAQQSSTLTRLTDLICLLTVLAAVVTASVPEDSDTSPNHNPVDATSSAGPVVACPRCLTLADRREAAKLKFEAIKRQILSKLSLQAKPNITVTFPPRDVVLDALRKSGGVTRDTETQGLDNSHREHHSYYEPQEHYEHSRGGYEQFPGDERFGEEKDDYYAKTSEIMTFAEPGATYHHHTLIDFHHPHDNPTRLTVKEATLWVHVISDGTAKPDSKATLYVFRITTNNTSASNFTSGTSFSPYDSSPDVQPDFLGTLKFNVSSAGWKSFDMKAQVARWFTESPATKLTLLIDCNANCGVRLSLFGRHNLQDTAINHHGERKVRHKKRSHSVSDFRPFLVVITEPADRRRTRRHTITCNEKSTGCCKQSLYVNFKDLKWDDWIIAPRGYYANYCMGDCASGPRTPDTLAHFHTHVIEEYRNRNPYASIVPCCAPTRLSSMSLIYYDSNTNIIKTDLPKMIVEECGCT